VKPLFLFWNADILRCGKHCFGITALMKLWLVFRHDYFEMKQLKSLKEGGQISERAICSAFCNRVSWWGINHHENFRSPRSRWRISAIVLRVQPKDRVYNSRLSISRLGQCAENWTTVWENMPHSKLMGITFWRLHRVNIKINISFERRSPSPARGR
jgi:hypothetical protein